MSILVLASLAAAAPEYRALGTEPFWSLRIAAGRIRLEETGLPDVDVAAPRVRTAGNTRTYETRTLRVAIERRTCSDGMSDRIYPDTVTVRARGRVLSGCGGLGVPASIAGAWRLTAIDGRPLRVDAAEVRFADRRMQGRICNGFSAPYREVDGTLRIGVVMATRMACPGVLGDAERRAFALAGRPLTVSAPTPDTRLLTGDGGSMTLTRRR